MDPNEVLRQLRQLVVDMQAIIESGEDPAEPGEYYRIASEATDGIDNLDNWMTSGGFLPTPWEGDRAASVRRAVVESHRRHAEAPGRDGWCSWTGEAS